jgi:hypothetical protein
MKKTFEIDIFRQSLTPKMTKIGCLLVVLAMIAVFGIGFIRPDIPEEWRSISVGTSREQVLRIIPDTLIDLRELKGFDIATREYTQWGVRKCWWQLELIYDEADMVKSIEARFTDPNCGLYNTKWTPMP